MWRQNEKKGRYVANGRGEKKVKERLEHSRFEREEEKKRKYIRGEEEEQGTKKEKKYSNRKKKRRMIMKITYLRGEAEKNGEESKSNINYVRDLLKRRRKE